MAAPRSSLVRIALVGGLAVGLWQLWQYDDSQAVATADELPVELRDEPDLYLENAIINQYHPNGALKYRLAAQSITHFEDEVRTRLQQPALVLHSLEGRAWEVTARRGSIRDQPTPDGELEEVVFLRDDVILEQRLPPPQSMVINSSVLYLYPDRDLAETNEDANINTHTGRTKAAAMRSDLVTGVVDLDSDEQQRVKTIVLPNQFK